MTEQQATTEWEVRVRFRITVEGGEEDASAVAAATGQAVAMLPFLSGQPELEVEEVAPLHRRLPSVAAADQQAQELADSQTAQGSPIEEVDA